MVFFFQFLLLHHYGGISLSDSRFSIALLRSGELEAIHSSVVDFAFEALYDLVLAFLVSDFEDFSSHT